MKQKRYLLIAIKYKHCLALLYQFSSLLHVPNILKQILNSSYGTSTSSA